MSQDIASILKNVVFPDDHDPTYILAVSDTAYRQTAIRKKKGKRAKIAAAIEIQRLWRGYRTRDKLYNLLTFGKKKKKWTRAEAAQAIKNTWKSYCDKKIFKYYKELINFHHKGSPMSLLYSINPLEAKLLDRASGGIVRFRLGGDSFPPTIYYKIFTNSSIVDMCSFSPRDYISNDSIHWYKRQENNDWRPIEHCRVYPGEIYTEKPVPFHYSKYKRREDVIKRRKQRKIDWLKKLYYMEDVSDDNIDELVEWSYHLNFDKYISDWKTIATSESTSTD